jgi:S-DNA-T family DNA segregation ATPase FtsK/SpoIIIE
MAGAEKLLGAGDLLYLSSEFGKPKRIQAPYVSEKEVKRAVNWIESKTQELEFKTKEGLEENLAEELERVHESAETTYGGEGELEDPLYEEAKQVVVDAQKASASLLQRRLKVGYARAARLLDILEEKGVVGPGEGAKPREVYGARKEEEEL